MSCFELVTKPSFNKGGTCMDQLKLISEDGTARDLLLDDTRKRFSFGELGTQVFYDYDSDGVAFPHKLSHLHVKDPQACEYLVFVDGKLMGLGVAAQEGEGGWFLQMQVLDEKTGEQLEPPLEYKVATGHVKILHMNYVEMLKKEGRLAEEGITGEYQTWGPKDDDEPVHQGESTDL